ncbi:LPXTG cell wall anchor domain-containing protein [Streptomyces sp. SP17BM10]|nr:LPXTG cell wall anchor domain-containing protein [Streptomyces sp. SP17BM10]MEE1782584.1 LPXTG cell wall anchor domain-containing protein [Streptomyces sp. SP17BM10]MEE1782585.1 LPXTG cell wall anchor domain-containing protein [Streptomyces sp. SP17BM10]
MASTGAGDVELLGAAGLALLLGGGVLYRRARAGAR